MLGATGTINKEGLTILKASYGVQGNFTDVTKEVQGLVKDGNLDFIVSAQSLGILDPAPGILKDLQVQHVINGGHPNLDTVQDGKQIKLSAPTVKHNVNHGYNFVKSLWSAVIIFFVGLLVMDSYHTGNYVFGTSVMKEGIESKENKAAAIVLALLTLLTFGHFNIWILLPLVLFIGWWRRGT